MHILCTTVCRSKQFNRPESCIRDHCFDKYARLQYPETYPLVLTPFVQASKSLAKRQREETEVTAAQKAAKKLRQEMKQRGHVGVLKKGEDPASDALEKALYKIATRFVTPTCYIDNTK